MPFQGRTELPGKGGDMSLDRKESPGGGVEVGPREQLVDVVQEEPKIGEGLGSAEGMPAPVVDGPRRSQREVRRPDRYPAVSYTHLTLPTICSV